VLIYFTLKLTYANRKEVSTCMKLFDFVIPADEHDCSTAACATFGRFCAAAALLPMNRSVQQQPVLPLDGSVLKQPVLPMNVSVQQQPVLPLDVPVQQQPVLPLDVYVYQINSLFCLYGWICTKAACAPFSCLFYNSLCRLLTYLF
jgi:hypothetical protein